MKASLYLEIGRNGWCNAWVAEFPGAHVSFPSQEQALEAMPGEVFSFAFFLRHFGEEVPEFKSIDFSVMDRQVFTVSFHPGDTQAFFSFDRIPLTKKEQKKNLRWLAHSRSMLQDLMNRLPPRAWSWKKEGRPGRQMGKMGGGWDLKTYLGHMAAAEKWYLTNFWDGLPRLPMAEDKLERIGLVRRQLDECFSKTTRDDRRRIVDRDGELWSLRKVLRRAIYHERYHARGIARLLLMNGWHVKEYIRKGLGV